MLSIKEYANIKNVTYEAVRQSVKRYEEELKDHIFVQGKTRYLDDFAMDFLDQKRSVNPVVIYEVSKDEEIERLNREVADLKDKVLKLQELLLDEQQKQLPLQQALQLADVEKEKAVHQALKEAGVRAEIEKKTAVDAAIKDEQEKAAREKSEAVDVAKKDTAVKKDAEFEPIRKELEATQNALGEANRKLAEPISLLEWIKTRGRKV